LKPKKREAVFQPEFIEDLRYWVENDPSTALRASRKLALRVFELIEAILRDPVEGIGKPEPLKYLAPGCWSRRLTLEHRIVYLVRDDRIDFLQARYHYNK
jgi:toxin YoeB